MINLWGPCPLASLSHLLPGTSPKDTGRCLPPLAYPCLTALAKRRKPYGNPPNQMPAGAPPPHPGVYRFGGHRRGRKRKGRVNALPLRMATCGGAQVARKPSLILRPGIKKCIKNLRMGGQFSIITRGHFSVVITMLKVSSRLTPMMRPP
jgi:hypothetical protein